MNVNKHTKLSLDVLIDDLMDLQKDAMKVATVTQVELICKCRRFRQNWAERMQINYLAVTLSFTKTLTDCDPKYCVLI